MEERLSWGLKKTKQNAPMLLWLLGMLKDGHGLSRYTCCVCLKRDCKGWIENLELLWAKKITTTLWKLHGSAKHTVYYLHWPGGKYPLGPWHSPPLLVPLLPLFYAPISHFGSSSCEHFQLSTCEPFSWDLKSYKHWWAHKEKVAAKCKVYR